MLRRCGIPVCFVVWDAQASVRDVSLQSSNSKIQVINLSSCSVNVVSPWNQFTVDISQVGGPICISTSTRMFAMSHHLRLLHKRHRLVLLMSKRHYSRESTVVSGQLLSRNLIKRVRFKDCYYNQLFCFVCTFVGYIFMQMRLSFCF